ncbi:MAG: hypothetical protein MZV63_05580 [Marinilabiliales bacterium]|nr:hypothetical protein [Marinilabiliales bacterium]
MNTSWNFQYRVSSKRYCTPNAILTLAEYIVDYASPEAGRERMEGY